MELPSSFGHQLLLLLLKLEQASTKKEKEKREREKDRELIVVDKTILNFLQKVSELESSFFLSGKKWHSQNVLYHFF